MRHPSPLPPPTVDTNLREGKCNTLFKCKWGIPHSKYPHNLKTQAQLEKKWQISAFQCNYASNLDQGNWNKMIVFRVIMYSQEYTSIHPHSTCMCHFCLSYSLLSLHLWSASPSRCWLLRVCIHTHRQIVECLGSVVTWKRRGLKMKTCLKNKNALPQLWKPGGS